MLGKPLGLDLRARTVTSAWHGGARRGQNGHHPECL